MIVFATEGSPKPVRGSIAISQPRPRSLLERGAIVPREVRAQLVGGDHGAIGVDDPGAASREGTSWASQGSSVRVRAFLRTSPA